MMNFVIFHKDGSLTLAEITAEKRVFTPMERVSECVNYLRERGIDVPLEFIITETKGSDWREQLETLIAERSEA